MSWGSYVQAVASLIFVIGLMLAALWVVRRYGVAGLNVARPSGRRRLALVEAMPLDGRRRLVLVRRDNTEHLLLLGGTTDLLIETGIAVPVFPKPDIPRSEEASP